MTSAAQVYWQVMFRLTAMLACVYGWCPGAADLALADEPKKPVANTKWDIESPPGTVVEQAIEVDEGTWMNLDVSPDGREICFDLLGDIYSMPIEGADGTNGMFPKRLSEGMRWDMQPRFSPDGQWLAFTSDRSGKNERAGDNIWIMAKDGTNAKQITNETFRLFNGPAWSPDGNYIVARKHFTGRRSLGSGEMWMFHRSASQSSAMTGVQLTKRPNDQKDVNEPIFSRDGRYLYYSQDATGGDTFEYDKDSHGQIYVIKRLDLHSGESESYITGPGGACRPTPSPDGKSIAFVRRLGSKTALHIMQADSGAIRMVYDSLERDMQEAWAIHGVYPSFAWTPDGTSVVIWAKGKIRRIDVATGNASIIPFRVKDSRTIRPPVRFPVTVALDEFPVRMLRWVQVSPNGRHVAYQTLGHIYIRDLPEGTPRRLTEQTEHFEFYPAFSADSRYVVYTTWNDEKLGSVRVSTVAASDQETWKVTSQPGHYVEPVFSPDGKNIVYSKVGGGFLTSPLWSRDSGLYRIAARGGDATLIHKSGGNPQFAGENTRLYFVDGNSNKDADNTGLYSIEMDGQKRRQHTNNQWATDYRVSPDGKWIAFVERFNVYVAPFVQTGQAIELGPGSSAIPTVKVSQEAGDWVHFSGDSQRLYWALGPKLYSVELAEAFAFLNSESALPKDAPASDPATNDSRKNDSTTVAAGSHASKTVGNKVNQREIGFTTRYARPTTTVALVGGRIVTMGDQGTIENGTIVVRGNRIQAVGSSDEVKVPDNATIIRTPGLVILPGLIDPHDHGAFANSGITPQQSWVNYAKLAFGVTTIHDPSHDTHSIFAASEMAKAGKIVAPRIFSTGTILYGAAGSYKAEIESLDDAKFHLRRMQAVGAFSVKSYNQPRRDQRQQVIAAARELGMMVVPEGGSTFMHNMTMIVDGHTGIEHTLPVQTAYGDVMDLWRGTLVGYTPTLSVAYGGISGERYWYEIDDLYAHPRLNQFIPPHVLQPRSRRRQKAPLEDYNHIRVAEIAKQVVRDGGLVQAGGHGQLAGMCTHWEMWSFVQGGMTPMEALHCGTINGARYLGLDRDLGSLEVGKLADLIVIERGADPTKEIRDSQRIAMVMANGRLFDASTMAELAGEKAPAPNFYFRTLGIGTAPAPIPSCSCSRPNEVLAW